MRSKPDIIVGFSSIACQFVSDVTIEVLPLTTAG
jgi:hypothetical protein